MIPRGSTTSAFVLIIAPAAARCSGTRRTIIMRRGAALSMRNSVEDDVGGVLMLVGATDPTKLAIQIEVLDNSGTLRSDAKGALPIINDAETSP